MVFKKCLQTVPWKKIAACMTLLSLLVSESAGAVETLVVKPSRVQETYPEIHLPQSLGQITQTHHAGPDFVICISDLHGHPGVQRNIAAILDTLAGSLDLGLVGLEGARQTVNTRTLGRFPLLPVRQMVADYFLAQGELTGAEWYSATGKHALRLEGVETAAVYDEALALARSLVNEEILGYCMDVAEALNGLKSRLYNRKLIQYDRRYQEWRNSRASLENLRAAALQAGADRSVVLQLQPPDSGIEPPREAVEAWNLRVREKMYDHPEQAALDEFIRRWEIVERLLSIAATPGEVDEFRRQPGNFALGPLLAFIRRQAGPESEKLDVADWSYTQCLQSAGRFYDLTDARSRLFVANLAGKMAQARSRVAVLITGGYHAAEIEAGLAQRNISYVMVQPVVPAGPPNNAYWDHLSGKRNRWDRMLASAAPSALATRPVSPDGFFPPDQLVGLSAMDRPEERNFARQCLLFLFAAAGGYFRQAGYALAQTLTQLKALARDYPGYESALPSSLGGASQAAGIWRTGSHYLIMPIPFKQPQGSLALMTVWNAEVPEKTLARGTSAALAGQTLFYGPEPLLRQGAEALRLPARAWVENFKAWAVAWIIAPLAAAFMTSKKALLQARPALQWASRLWEEAWARPRLGGVKPFYWRAFIAGLLFTLGSVLPGIGQKVADQTLRGFSLAGGSLGGGDIAGTSLYLRPAFSTARGSEHFRLETEQGLGAGGLFLKDQNTLAPVLLLSQKLNLGFRWPAFGRDDAWVLGATEDVLGQFSLAPNLSFETAAFTVNPYAGYSNPAWGNLRVVYTGGYGLASGSYQEMKLYGLQNGFLAAVQPLARGPELTGYWKSLAARLLQAWGWELTQRFGKVQVGVSQDYEQFSPASDFASTVRSELTLSGKVFKDWQIGLQVSDLSGRSMRDAWQAGVQVKIPIGRYRRVSLQSGEAVGQHVRPLAAQARVNTDVREFSQRYPTYQAFLAAVRNELSSSRDLMAMAADYSDVLYYTTLGWSRYDTRPAGLFDRTSAEEAYNLAHADSAASIGVCWTFSRLNAQFINALGASVQTRAFVASVFPDVPHTVNLLTTPESIYFLDYAQLYCAGVRVPELALEMMDRTYRAQYPGTPPNALNYVYQVDEKGKVRGVMLVMTETGKTLLRFLSVQGEPSRGLGSTPTRTLGFIGRMATGRLQLSFARLARWVLLAVAGAAGLAAWISPEISLVQLLAWAGLAAAFTLAVQAKRLIYGYQISNPDAGRPVLTPENIRDRLMPIMERLQRAGRLPEGFELKDLRLEVLPRTGGFFSVRLGEGGRTRHGGTRVRFHPNLLSVDAAEDIVCHEIWEAHLKGTRWAWMSHVLASVHEYGWSQLFPSRFWATPEESPRPRFYPQFKRPFKSQA